MIYDTEIILHKIRPNYKWGRSMLAGYYRGMHMSVWGGGGGNRVREQIFPMVIVLSVCYA